MIPLPFRAVAGALLLLSAQPLPAQAHEGHDHGRPAAAPLHQPVPTLEAVGAELQLVAVADGEGHLVIYVDRLATNEPVHDAQVEISVDGGGTTAALPMADGTYLFEAPWSVAEGRYQLVATVVAGDVADLLDGTLTVDASPVVATAGARLDWMVVGLAFLAGLGVAGLSRAIGRRPAGTTATAMLLLAISVLAAAPAGAHEGHDHGAEETVPLSGNAPRRLPDGSLNVPKATQRLLEIRTAVAAEGEVARSVTLAGRVIADPNHVGRAQATQAGSVMPPEGGFPLPGQRVERGQVLAHVVGAVGNVERGDVQARLAEVEKQLEIARRRVERLANLAGVVAEREVQDARAELAGLQRQRAALEPALTGREDIRAPIGGVISLATAAAGQVIDDRAEAVLFEIVDPDRLLVEAIGFDPLPAEGVMDATARSDGADTRLAFLTASPVRRNSGTSMLFRVDEAGPGLAAGTPVKVHVGLRARQAGIVLPRSAIVRGPEGLPMVWSHVTPLRFEPRPVRFRPLDARTVTVEAGVAPGERIVVEGAPLLSQIR